MSCLRFYHVVSQTTNGSISGEIAFNDSEIVFEYAKTKKTIYGRDVKKVTWLPNVKEGFVGIRISTKIFNKDGKRYIHRFSGFPEKDKSLIEHAFSTKYKQQISILGESKGDPDRKREHELVRQDVVERERKQEQERKNDRASQLKQLERDRQRKKQRERNLVEKKNANRRPSEDDDIEVIDIVTNIDSSKTLVEFKDIHGMVPRQELKQFNGKLEKKSSGNTWKLMSNVIEALSKIKITKSISLVRGKKEDKIYAIECAFKNNNGSLYFLKDAFIYIHTPTIYISFEEVHNIVFDIVESNSTKFFDLVIDIRTKKLSFCNISKCKVPILATFVLEHQLPTNDRYRLLCEMSLSEQTRTERQRKRQETKAAARDSPQSGSQSDIGGKNDSKSKSSTKSKSAKTKRKIMTKQSSASGRSDKLRRSKDDDEDEDEEEEEEEEEEDTPESSSDSDIMSILSMTPPGSDPSIGETSDEDVSSDDDDDESSNSDNESVRSSNYSDVAYFDPFTGDRFCSTYTDNSQPVVLLERHEEVLERLKRGLVDDNNQKEIPIRVDPRICYKRKKFSYVGESSPESSPRTSNKKFKSSRRKSFKYCDSPMSPTRESSPESMESRSDSRSPSTHRRKPTSKFRHRSPPSSPPNPHPPSTSAYQSKSKPQTVETPMPSSTKSFLGLAFTPPSKSNPNRSLRKTGTDVQTPAARQAAVDKRLEKLWKRTSDANRNSRIYTQLSASSPPLPITTSPLKAAPEPSGVEHNSKSKPSKSASVDNKSDTLSTTAPQASTSANPPTSYSQFVPSEPFQPALFGKVKKRIAWNSPLLLNPQPAPSSKVAENNLGKASQSKPVSLPVSQEQEDVREQVPEQTREQTQEQAREQVLQQIREQIQEQTRKQQVPDQIQEPIRKQQVPDQIQESTRKQQQEPEQIQEQVLEEEKQEEQIDVRIKIDADNPGNLLGVEVTRSYRPFLQPVAPITLIKQEVMDQGQDESQIVDPQPSTSAAAYGINSSQDWAPGSVSFAGNGTAKIKVERDELCHNDNHNPTNAENMAWIRSQPLVPPPPPIIKQEAEVETVDMDYVNLDSAEIEPNQNLNLSALANTSSSSSSSSNSNIVLNPSFESTQMRKSHINTSRKKRPGSRNRTGSPMSSRSDFNYHFQSPNREDEIRSSWPQLSVLDLNTERRVGPPYLMISERVYYYECAAVGHSPITPVQNRRVVPRLPPSDFRTNAASTISISNIINNYDSRILDRFDYRDETGQYPTYSDFTRNFENANQNQSLLSRDPGQSQNRSENIPANNSPYCSEALNPASSCNRVPEKSNDSNVENHSDENPNRNREIRQRPSRTNDNQHSTSNRSHNNDEVVPTPSSTGGPPSVSSQTSLASSSKTDVRTQRVNKSNKATAPSLPTSVRPPIPSPSATPARTASPNPPVRRPGDRVSNYSFQHNRNRSPKRSSGQSKRTPSNHRPPSNEPAKAASVATPGSSASCSRQDSRKRSARSQDVKPDPAKMLIPIKPNNSTPGNPYALEILPHTGSPIGHGRVNLENGRSILFFSDWRPFSSRRKFWSNPQGDENENIYYPLGPCIEIYNPCVVCYTCRAIGHKKTDCRYERYFTQVTQGQNSPSPWQTENNGQNQGQGHGQGPSWYQGTAAYQYRNNDEGQGYGHGYGHDTRPYVNQMNQRAQQFDMSPPLLNMNSNLRSQQADRRNEGEWNGYNNYMNPSQNYGHNNNSNRNYYNDGPRYY